MGSSWLSELSIHKLEAETDAERVRALDIVGSSPPEKDVSVHFKRQPCPPEPLLSQSLTVDEPVQFTAYRPRFVCPGKWTKMLVFAHLDERPQWLDADEDAPIEEMERQAAQILGTDLEDYRHSMDDARSAIPRDGEITLVPEMTGIEFNPGRRTFLWKDGVTVHQEAFDLRAAATLDGQIARGRLTIFLGHLILAEISLSIRVASNPVAATPREKANQGTSARRFRRIFPSYSHRDVQLVEAMERQARALGENTCAIGCIFAAASNGATSCRSSCVAPISSNSSGRTTRRAAITSRENGAMHWRLGDKDS